MSPPRIVPVPVAKPDLTRHLPSLIDGDPREQTRRALMERGLLGSWQSLGNYSGGISPWSIGSPGSPKSASPGRLPSSTDRDLPQSRPSSAATERKPSLVDSWDRLMTEQPDIVAVPPGVDIKKNIEAATGPVLPVPNFFWFRHIMRPRGPYDYKKSHGRQYEDFGNLNYGAMGRAAGFSRDSLLRGAGYAHAQSSNKGQGEPTSQLGVVLGIGGTSPYGDDVKDQFWITRGMDYYDRYLSSKLRRGDAK